MQYLNNLLEKAYKGGGEVLKKHLPVYKKKQNSPRDLLDYINAKHKLDRG